jgi:hypothetical protein
MEVHYIVALSGELGSGSNGSNEHGELRPQRPILNRMLILMICIRNRKLMVHSYSSGCMSRNLNICNRVVD